MALRVQNYEEVRLVQPFVAKSLTDFLSISVFALEIIRGLVRQQGLSVISIPSHPFDGNSSQFDTHV